VRICFVCLGNICRSPTAEAVMTKLVRDAGLEGQVTIDSAGTGAWHAGELADPRTRAAAAKRGITMTHRARQFTRADLAAFDLVLVMDADNLRNVKVLVGDGAHDVRLLRSFDATAPHGAHVPDPYSGGEAGFDEVLDLCERACAGVLEHVRATLAARGG
jgi:protein-tyrosine phosphatase